LLPEEDLVFYIRCGAKALPLLSLFKIRVGWLVEECQPTAVVTKPSASVPPFTFYQWNELEAEMNDAGVILRFRAQSLGNSTPIEMMVMH